MPRIPGTTIPLIDDSRAGVRILVRVAFAVAVAVGALGVVAGLEPLLSRPYFFPAFAAIAFSAIVAGGGTARSRPCCSPPGTVTGTSRPGARSRWPSRTS